MSILPLAAKYWNSLEDKILSVNQDIFNVLGKYGYKYKKRFKQLQIDAKAYDIIFYVLHRGIQTGVTIIPDLVSPHRPYPVYVYFFAISLYLLSPKMSMRKAARITGLCFEIAKFSASAICRVKKNLDSKIPELTALFVNIANEQLCDGGGNGAETVSSEPVASQAAPFKLRLQKVFSTPFIIRFVNMLKNRMPTLSEKMQFAEYAGRCCRKYFILYGQLLI